MTGKQLKNSILQWAIQGKLVPQDPNDEPASVLLEKIRKEKERLIKEKKIKPDKNESIIYRGEDNSYYEKILATGEVKCIDEEIPFEIPQSWCWVRLGAIATIIGGFAFPSESIKSEKGYRVIRISDFNDSKIVYNKVVRYNGDADLTQYEICERDILMAMTGGTVGKSVFLTELPEKHMLLNQRVAIIRNKYIFDEYLNLVITSPITIDVVNSRKNSTNDNISMVDIYNFLVPVPPTNEQKKIVQKIQEAMPFVYTYGKSQEALDKLNAEIFDKLRKSVLQEAIQGKLVPQDPNDEPSSVLLERIKEDKTKLFKEGKLKKKDVVDSVIFKCDDNKYYEQLGKETIEITEEIPFDLPDSWAWTRLSTIVIMTIGKTPPRGIQSFWTDGIYPWVSISDMSEGGIINKTKEKVSEYAASNVFSAISPKGSLLMSFKLTVGRTSILGIDAYHNEAIITILPYMDNNNIMKMYLLKLLPILSTHGDSKDAIKGKTLNSKSLAKLLVPLPPIKEQQRIVAQIEKLFEQLK